MLSIVCVRDVRQVMCFTKHILDVFATKHCERCINIYLSVNISQHYVIWLVHFHMTYIYRYVLP